MWNGATVPAGWALCDGGTYTLMAGGTTVTPNLMSRFIVGANAAGGTGTAGTYTLGNIGGENAHVLTIAEMPSHDHGGSVSGGAHTHTYADNYSQSNCKNGVFSSSSGCFMTQTNDLSQTLTTTTGDGAHTHTISAQGGGAAHENRPPYYALAYIMKL
jgi:microcystin-dependent protein